MTEASIRVVTLSVYGPANPDWERRHPLLRTTLRELDADVVALQEVPVDEEFLDDLLGGSSVRASRSGTAEGCSTGRWTGSGPATTTGSSPTWSGRPTRPGSAATTERTRQPGRMSAVDLSDETHVPVTLDDHDHVEGPFFHGTKAVLEVGITRVVK